MAAGQKLCVDSDTGDSALWTARRGPRGEIIRRILCPDFDQLIGNQGRVLRSQEEHSLIIYGQRHYMRLSYLLHIEYGAGEAVVTKTVSVFNK